ncbi:BREX-1 system phosphatase PglZ type A [Fictibacillus sp. WQ 8-8]|uniref:BREX-1 system phosphatase PglZ type A n=1 Tax=Fictibacillus sp. WQ 8-8 TaxID=2938788 RepID=UPI00210B9912|nr:BREX-1 system phosphatase PglZ type A [Fictibacillus sp. WQ 8-8]MCQ6266316.1 BREX-1 system phosphatase PglZ type A [Fictibacillus sp. WQ 8-8]
MNLKDVKRVLQDTFNKELTDGKKRHIVFWYDEEGEFLEDIDGLNLNNIRLWKLTESNLFATKFELEKKDSDSHFLIYANMSKPSPKEDWFLDIYKYSLEFATDKITVIMRDLNVTNDSLRPVFKKYTKFFNNKERYSIFQSYYIQEYTDEVIDIAVLSALCKSHLNNLDEVIKVLFRELNHERKNAWENIQKFGDEESFWTLVEKHYNYSLEQRSIQTLLIFFTLSNISATLEAPIPKTWTKYISTRPTNCIILMNQFMNNKTDRFEYNKMSILIENMVKVNDYVDEWEMKDYINTDAFQIFDEKIINYISTQLNNNIHQYDVYIDTIAKRRTLHWYPEFKYEYESLIHAINLLKIAYELDFFIRQQSPYEMFKAYSEDYYKIDTAYRKFYVAYDKLQNKERLSSLKEKVENTYTNWFTDELSIKWCDAIDNELMEHWAIPGMDQQFEFYKTTIQPYLGKGERVFVIISDALRFEAAKELSELLNQERKGSTEISSMQGVLPSYTDLGMAALLPHKQISYEDGQVIVDGIRASGTDNRNSILQRYVNDSLALQYKDIIEMNRQELREAVSGKKLIYIYHNSIDARGDHAATEREVFNAVEDTFQEISSLINHLVNSVSASNMVITADHGFIYNRDRLQESDKIVKNMDGAIIEKRRFILSDYKPDLEGTMKFSMRYLLYDNEKYVTVPRGSNRFAVKGAGANYVHGGAMLQENVIPVIKFKNDRSGKNDLSKAEVKLTSISRKITNMIAYLDFFQTDKVEDKKKPLRLKIYFTDIEGNRISNENIIIADSKSSKPEERTYKEKFVFKNMTYDKAMKYYLILEDEEESVENVYDKIPFTIDIAISNDFGF